MSIPDRRRKWFDDERGHRQVPACERRATVHPHLSKLAIRQPTGPAQKSYVVQRRRGRILLLPDPGIISSVVQSIRHTFISPGNQPFGALRETCELAALVVQSVLG